MEIPINKINDYMADTAYLYISAQIKPLTNRRGKLHWVVSLGKDTASNFNNSFDVELLPLYKNHWYRISKLFKIPKPLHNNDSLKIYLWNYSKRKIVISNMIIERITYK